MNQSSEIQSAFVFFATAHLFREHSLDSATELSVSWRRLPPSRGRDCSPSAEKYVHVVSAMEANEGPIIHLSSVFMTNGRADTPSHSVLESCRFRVPAFYQRQHDLCGCATCVGRLEFVDPCHKRSPWTSFAAVFRQRHTPAWCWPWKHAWVRPLKIASSSRAPWPPVIHLVLLERLLAMLRGHDGSVSSTWSY